MPRHARAAPFLHEYAISVDQERAAFDTAHLLAVHVLLLDDTVKSAQYFVGVGNERKRQILFFFEVFVRFKGIT